jgi:hypothetical protein
MAKMTLRTGLSKWLTAALVCAGAYACGSSGDDGGLGSNGGSGGKPGGSGCTTHPECASGICQNGTCTDPGSGGSSAGGSSAGGSSAGGSSAGGSSSGGSNSGGVGGGTPGGPRFPGAGDTWRPITPGCGPETADQCTGTCEKAGGTPGVTIVRPPATLCFSGTGDATPNDPAVVIEQVIEKLNGKEYVHIRITFDPAFVDNTYGEGTCCGWKPKGDKMGMTRPGHVFKDLTGSDHTELLLTDAQGNTVMNFKLDFITADTASSCGFGTLGVAGGDGEMIQGNPAHVLAVATSLDRNLNGCGYCKSAACASSGDCTIDSPATDDKYTPNPATPNWDYRQVYEVWIDAAAFNGLGFGQAYITYTHASPAKTQDTIDVDSTPCPPEWDKPYCPPGVVQEGGNCFGSGGASGTGGTGGTGGTCPPNQQIYVTSEGASICTPIPFAGYPNRAPCPTGYVLDVASEGQFCIPAS